MTAPSVLVTGANGFIGSHLCDAFLSAGWDVHGLVRPGADLRFLGDPRVRLVRGDLTRIQEIAFPDMVNVIVHAAAVVSDNATAREAEQNIFRITAALADEALRRWPRLQRFVYVSTALVLGYGADDISEERPGRSASYVPYARMKARAEEYLRQRHAADGLPVVILRPGDVYGPRDRTSCEEMLRSIERRVPLRLGSGNRRFGLCAPANVCQAALLAATRPGVVGRAYTVVNGRSPTWREFFEALQHGMGRRQRLYVPVSFVLVVALIMEAARRLLPSLRPPINFYRVRRITTQSTYSLAQTTAELGYVPDDDYASLFASIVEWYRSEKARAQQRREQP